MDPSGVANKKGEVRLVRGRDCKQHRKQEVCTNDPSMQIRALPTALIQKKKYGVILRCGI